MVLLFAVTLFLSAMLLFWIQPLFSKMVLPYLGGTPGVWNTCMVFYQAALLAGYASAHAMIRRFGVKRQAVLHCLFLGAGFFFLPISANYASPPPAAGAPILWLLHLLLVCIGWPFWVISFTAPMLQRWFSFTRHKEAHDPYFLYAASNLGSLAVLLGYPILIEPYFRLSNQALAWSAGYVALFFLSLICAVALWRTPSISIHIEKREQPDNQTRISQTGISQTRITASDRLRWLLLSLAPSSMMLGVTTYMTTDLAAAPLLWIAPLAIYLSTFILVFARKTLFRRGLLLRIQPYLLAPPVLLFFWGSKVPLFINFPIHLTAFFIHAMVCHGELAKRRPATSHLTEFYLWMAAGGMAGGLINAIAAPFLFDAPLEYPLAIAAAAMLRPRQSNPKPNTRRFAYGLLAGLGILLLGPLIGNPDAAYHVGIFGLLIVSSLFAAYFYGWVNRPIVLGFLLAVLIVGGFRINDAYRKVLHRERSFFGPLLIRMDPKEEYFLFYHGTTLHGAQSRHPSNHMNPLTYFTEAGPFGQILSAMNSLSPAPRTMAIAGLGVGAIAAYGRAGDAIDYYEIDPNVVRIAQHSDYFTFLRDSKAAIQIHLGDARLTLEKAPDLSYDVIIMDAFSSGSIPTHLLTREAFEMIRTKLKKDGVLIYQISNRYLNLAPVLAGLAREADWRALIQRDLDKSYVEKEKMIYPSIWAAMGPPSGVLEKLSEDPAWEELRPTPGFQVWTDDFSNLLSVIKPPRWD
ncbi:MAG: fused MFS/spermidine synthase [Candidatus Omnitrophica bacterium]|nr:fused MFS/spermidine synthase [Candidatus Omnitrophota bacterium]